MIIGILIFVVSTIIFIIAIGEDKSTLFIPLIALSMLGYNLSLYFCLKGYFL